ncbi:MAG: 2OG-Fe(II) oxygenase family protein [Nanoarchaeota archaeon]
MLNEWISADYLKSVNELNKKFKNNKPFPHLVLKDFFIEKKIIPVLLALENEIFVSKNTDLFQFQQTENDIKGSEITVLKEFNDFFNSKEFGEFIFKITGIKISLGKIDMSGFVYSKTDYLLPHDDRLEGRKIAYILNLSEKFKKGDGGKLQFFDVKNKKPSKIVKSFIPSFNTLALFEVSENSFHQVEEVLVNKERISFAGWFYGD